MPIQALTKWFAKFPFLFCRHVLDQYSQDGRRQPRLLAKSTGGHYQLQEAAESGGDYRGDPAVSEPTLLPVCPAGNPGKPGEGHSTGCLGKPGEGHSTGCLSKPGRVGTGCLSKPGEGHSTGCLSKPGRVSTGCLSKPGEGHSTGYVSKPGEGHSTGCLRKPGEGHSTGCLSKPGRVTVLGVWVNQGGPLAEKTLMSEFHNTFRLIPPSEKIMIAAAEMIE